MQLTYEREDPPTDWPDDLWNVARLIPTTTEEPSDALVVRFQTAPIGVAGQNGAQIEDVLHVAEARLQMFQANPKTRCRENAIALTKIQEALHWLDQRTMVRQELGVEGTDQPHDGAIPTVLGSLHC